MSSALKLAGEFDPSAAYVALGASGYFATRDTLAKEAAFFQSVDALRHVVSTLEFSQPWLQEQKEQFIRQSKSRIDPAELGEQLEAIFGMLDRGQLISVITGPPGAAKSTIASLWARVVRSKYKDMPVLCLAQEKTALQRLQDKIGLSDSTGWTMEEALNKTAPWPRAAAIIVEEAGMFGTEDFARLLKRAQEIGAVKIMLIGDDRQLVSDAPGQPFRWLCEQEVTDKIILQNSFRQKNLWLRQAVQALYKGDMAEALRLMPRHFMAQDAMLDKIKEIAAEAVAESTLVLVHGCPLVRRQIVDALPQFRIMSLAEAQGLAIDRVILVLGAEINRAEFLVGCSRQRFDLDVLVDTAVYPDETDFIHRILPYPRNLMALDVIPANQVLGLVGG